MARVLVTSQVSAFHFFHFAPQGIIYADRLVVIALDAYRDFGCLSSSIHDVWAHRPGTTTHETRGTYFPGMAFETFPFPTPTPDLERIGESYKRQRRQTML